MLTLTLPPDRANVAAVREHLGLDEAELDKAFGVVPIDPDKHLYTILVSPDAARRVQGSPGVGGTFANPPIEPI